MTQLCLALLLALPAPTPDAQPPEARIDFPLPSALTDAAVMRVRGSSRDADGVAAVRVNGVPASTVDGFVHWWAIVPLELGENEITVETLDGAGNLDPAAATTIVRRDAVIVYRPVEVTVSPTGENCVLGELDVIPPFVEWDFRISKLDLVTHETSLVSSQTKGGGPPLLSLAEIEYDPHAPRLLVTDPIAGALFTIDLATGNRAVLSDEFHGLGPSIDAAFGLAVDRDQQRAWVVNWSLLSDKSTVVEVNLLTGKRKLVAGPSKGVGPWTGLMRGVELHPDGKRLLITTELDPGVLAVDLANGNKAWISTVGGAIGPTWKQPEDVTIGPAGTAWVTDSLQGSVFAVDMLAGTHRRVGSREHPLGSYADLYGIDLDAARRRVLMATYDWGAILALELTTGETQVAFRTSIGSGPALRSAGRLEQLAPDGTRVAVLDPWGHAVVAIDVLSGTRTVLSGPDHGSGYGLGQPHDLAVSSSVLRGGLIVLDRLKETLVHVDVGTGDRTLLSGDGVGSGASFGHPACMVVPGAEERALVADWAQDFSGWSMIEVDLVSGDRVPFSDATHGSGRMFDDASDMELDLAGGRVFLSARAWIHAVDLGNGDRTLVSGPGVGSGPLFSNHGAAELAWDPIRERLYVQDNGKGVFEVDPLTGARDLIAPIDLTKGPGMRPSGFELLRRPGHGTPLLLHSDSDFDLLGALDLDVDPTSGEVPAWRAILSR